MAWVSTVAQAARDAALYNFWLHPAPTTEPPASRSSRPTPDKPVILRDDSLKEHIAPTTAETEVANGLLAGYSLEEIAAVRKVKIGTVRDQINSMVAKTSASRQTDMVTLMLTLTGL